MNRITFYSLAVLLISRYHTILAKPADTVEIRVTSAFQQEENEVMAVVKNPCSSSGWSINTKERILNGYLDTIVAAVYTRTNAKEEFEEVYSELLCETLEYPEYGTLSQTIIDMIFADRKDWCEFDEGQKDIIGTVRFDTSSDPYHQSPKSIPFEAEFRLMTFSQSLKKGHPNYWFKVDFAVGGDTHFSKPDNSSKQSESSVEARVTSAYQQHEDEYLTLVKDHCSSSGWAINTKKFISIDGLDGNYMAVVYTRSDPSEEFKEIYSEFLCETLFDIHGEFPVQIVDMIFPGLESWCEFQPGKTAIVGKAKVTLDYYDLPKSTPFEAEVRIMTYSQTEKKGQPDYWFKVNFAIEGDIHAPNQ